jgi:prevent-host-death family protein
LTNIIISITIIAIMPTLMPNDTGATTITAMDLRRQPGRVLDRVDYRREIFIVERAGASKAAIVPLREYWEMKRLKAEARARAGEIIDEMRERNKDIDPEEFQQQTEKAIREVRAAREKEHGLS